jgi:hypothetical protein
MDKLTVDVLRLFGTRLYGAHHVHHHFFTTPTRPRYLAVFLFGVNQSVGASLFDIAALSSIAC